MTTVSTPGGQNVDVLEAEEVTQVGWREEHVGQILLEPSEEMIRVSAIMRPDVSVGRRAAFLTWVDSSLAAVLECEDPRDLGWYPSRFSPGAWFLTATADALPFG